MNFIPFADLWFALRHTIVPLPLLMSSRSISPPCSILHSPKIRIACLIRLRHSKSESVLQNQYPDQAVQQTRFSGLKQVFGEFQKNASKFWQNIFADKISGSGDLILAVFQRRPRCPVESFLADSGAQKHFFGPCTKMHFFLQKIFPLTKFWGPTTSRGHFPAPGVRF